MPQTKRSSSAAGLADHAATTTAAPWWEWLSPSSWWEWMLGGGGGGGGGGAAAAEADAMEEEVEAVTVAPKPKPKPQPQPHAKKPRVEKEKEKAAAASTVDGGGAAAAAATKGAKMEIIEVEAEAPTKGKREAKKQPAAASSGAVAVATAPETKEDKPKRGGKKQAESAAAATTTTTTTTPMVEPKPTSTKPPAPAAAAAAAAATAAATTTTTSTTRRGPRPDAYVPGGRDAFEVVEDYAALLNQTNITNNRNNNKFMVLQVLQEKSTGTFCFFSRWGRVGEPGQNDLKRFPTLAAAEKAFESKFRDKTKNDWSERGSFVKHEDKYELVEVDESSEGGGGGSSSAADGAPLGRLSKAQVERGQGVLAELRAVLTQQPSSSSSSSSTAATTTTAHRVAELSARYYTLIPTVVGRQKAPPLDTLDLIQEKEELLKFWLRMGFEDMADDKPKLAPIDGVMELPLPSTLREAVSGVADAPSVSSSTSRGEALAKSQVGNPVRKMDASLYAAIMLYTSNSIFADLNRALREERRERVRRYFHYLRLFLEALRTLPAKPTTLWRGVSVDLSTTYKVGSVVTWWGVSSCTSAESVARAFMAGCGGKCTLLRVHAKTAADISQITFYSHEKESLLAPGTQLKVLSCVVKGNVTEIELEEVGRACQ